MGIDVEITNNWRAIRDILTHEDIWWRIADDQDQETFEPPEGPMYLLGKIDDEIAGLFIITEDMESHYQCLPEYRHLKNELGQAFLDEAAKHFDQVTAQIPKAHKNVHYFAIKNGYKMTSETYTDRFYVKDLAPHRAGG